MARIDSRDHVRGWLERIHKAVEMGDYEAAGRLEKQLWEEALQKAAMHICGTSPSDLCATALTSRNIQFPRKYGYG